MTATLLEQPALTQEQVASFEENGFLHCRNVIGREELDALRRDEERVTGPAMKTVLRSQDYSYRQDPQTHRMILHRVDYAHLKGSALFNLMGNPRLLRMAEAIQGRNVLPGGFALVVKTPGYGVSVPWHRDPAHCRVRHGVNMGVYLDDATEENGMLHVIPKSHKREDIDLTAWIEEHGFKLPGAIPVHAKAGDVVMHSENVLHGSRTVRSNATRRVIYYGCRTIEEQLSRGLDAGWVRAVGKVLLSAIRARAESPLGRDETPFEWNPTSSEYFPTLEPGEYVEMRLRE